MKEEVLADDDALMRATRSGDEAAFTLLVERYQKSIARMMKIMVGDDDVATDLTQDTFTKLWSKRKSFDSSSSFRPWLFAIARNRARSHLRWSRVRKRRQDEVENTRTPLSELEGQDEKRQVQDALQRLSKPEREIIALRFGEDLAFGEIAKILKISVGNARVRAHRALERLKNEVNR